MWPVLWMAYFYGTFGAAAACASTAVAHGAALLSMPPGVGSLDRWIDVVATVIVVAAVARTLAARNDRLVRALTAEARVDPLTGLLNRRGLAERLAPEIARAARSEETLAAVAIDIDHFKCVNDEHGHDAGDRVLAWLGALIAEEARGADIAARVGGEEFVVVQPGSGPAAAHAFAERLRVRVAAAGLGDGITPTISCGVAAGGLDAGATDVQPLLDAADDALYAAKRAGRNRTVVAEPATA